MSIKKLIGDSMGLLYKNKYITLRDGNISFKPKNKSYFYISAGSVKKDNINEDQIIKINFSDTGIWYDNTSIYKPSRELSMHSYLQTDNKFKKKDLFVVHSHPKNILSYMKLNETKNNRELNTIKDYFPEVNVGSIGKNVIYHEAGSYELAKNCFNNILNHSHVGLERHGLMSIGDNVDKIFEDIETLEYYCEIVLKT